MRRSLKDLEDVIENNRQWIDRINKENTNLYYKLGDKEKEMVDLMKSLDEERRKQQLLEYVIKSQQETIEFLTKQKFTAEDIEFAAIKRYRGWDCLYLNGQSINTDRAVDLTIYCDNNEPVRITEEIV